MDKQIQCKECDCWIPLGSLYCNWCGKAQDAQTVQEEAQEMQDLAESNAQLLADNTQMRALLVGWYGLWSMRDWRAGADALADATQVFVNER